MQQAINFIPTQNLHVCSPVGPSPRAVSQAQASASQVSGLLGRRQLGSDGFLWDLDPPDPWSANRGS